MEIETLTKKLATAEKERVALTELRCASLETAMKHAAESVHARADAAKSRDLLGEVQKHFSKNHMHAGGCSIFAPTEGKCSCGHDDIEARIDAHLKPPAPKRVQRSRRKGSRLPPLAIVVTRPTKWGNPFPMIDGDKTRAVAMYRRWLAETQQGRDIAEAARRELRGKVLACFCPLDGPCHADVLLQIANRE